MRVWSRARLKCLSVISCSDWVWGVLPRGRNLLVSIGPALADKYLPSCPGGQSMHAAEWPGELFAVGYHACVPIQGVITASSSCLGLQQATRCVFA